MLGGRSVHEILSEEVVSLFVHSGETVEKIHAFFGVGPFCEDDVNEFIDARTLGAGSIRCGNDLIDHRDNRVVLMRVERAQRVSGCGVRSLEKSKKIRGQCRQNTASHEQPQRFTPLHNSSLTILHDSNASARGARVLKNSRGSPGHSPKSSLRTFFKT